MSWCEYEPAVVEEWQRRRRQYLAESKLIRRLGLVACLLFTASLFIPFGTFSTKFVLWMVTFGVLVAVDGFRVRRLLKCPNCSEIPFMSGGLVSISNPSRSEHCGKLLRSQLSASQRLGSAHELD